MECLTRHWTSAVTVVAAVVLPMAFPSSSAADCPAGNPTCTVNSVQYTCDRDCHGATVCNYSNLGFSSCDNDCVLDGFCVLCISYSGGAVVKASGGKDIICLEDGNPTAGAGADNITAKGGDDIIQTGAGADIINAGSGDDTVWGDDGDDTITGGTGGDTIHGGNDNDVVTADGGEDWIYAGNGDDDLDGGDATDHIWGEAGDDIIDGGNAKDYLYGEDGDDTIYGGSGDDFIYGGPHNDRIFGQGDNDTIYAGDGAPDYEVSNNFVDGGTGNDTIDGQRGNDVLWGGGGDDTICGWGGRDVIKGGNGDDDLSSNNYLNLQGSPELDYGAILCGGAGEDVLLAVGPSHQCVDAGDDQKNPGRGSIVIWGQPYHFDCFYGYRSEGTPAPTPGPDDLATTRNCEDVLGPVTEDDTISCGCDDSDQGSFPLPFPTATPTP